MAQPPQLLRRMHAAPVGSAIRAVRLRRTDRLPVPALNLEPAIRKLASPSISKSEASAATAVSYLTPVAEEAASISCSEVLHLEWHLTARAYLLVMREPVFSQYECLLPFEKFEAVHAGLLNELAQLPRRNLPDP